MSAELYIVLAILWWSSAEVILLHGYTRSSDLRHYDRWAVRVIAVFGPVVAAVIWLAWLWADSPEDSKNPLIRRSRRNP